MQLVLTKLANNWCQKVGKLVIIVIFIKLMRLLHDNHVFCIIPIVSILWLLLLVGVIWGCR